MKSSVKNDRPLTLSGTLVLRCAYALLAIPCLMFFLFYLRPMVGSVLSIAFCIFLWRVLKTVHSDDDIEISIPVLILLVTLIVVWCASSGLGGLVPQKHDYVCRNPTFHDLIHNSWPVIVNVDGQPHTLVYYFTFWLPPALVGKACSLVNAKLGTFAGNMALLLWGSVYALVALLLLALKTRSTGSGSWLKILAVFVFFSGMDCLGWLLYCSITGFGVFRCHLEWWAGLWQYSSMTTQLGWVPNQAIPTWLATAMFLNERSWGRMVLCVALLFACAPFPSIGLGILVLVWGIMKNEHRSGLLKRIQEWMPALLCSFMIVAVFALLFKSNTRVNSDVMPRFGTRLNSLAAVCMYLSFVVLEFGVLAGILYRRNRKDMIFLGAVGSLAALPTFFIISNTDWTMRVSIPALFVMMYYALDGLFSGEVKLPIKRAFLVVVLCVGSVTGVCELVETLALEHPGFVHPWDDQHPGCEKMDETELRGWCKTALPPLKDCQQTFFFRCLARTPNEQAKSACEVTK